MSADGTRQAGTVGRPGDGCTDVRDTHSHWCGFCGALLMFTRMQCELLRIVPPCPRCGETDWRPDGEGE